MTTSQLRSAAAARALRLSLQGAVVQPGDMDYVRGRTVWNGAVNRYPALIAWCAGEADVAAAVRVARDYGLPLSVRGGGHDWAGRALRDGGLVIDLTGMRTVELNPADQLATAGGGATAGDVLTAARPYQLAAVTGTVKAVGLAGLTLAGGYGPLNGRHGLALDNLVSARVVLADGRVVTASEAGDPDLIWALRGGGGAFGVVTEAAYRIHPLASVLAGFVFYPLDQAETVLRGYRDLIATAPDELTVMTGFCTGPDGQPVLFLFPVWSGGQDREEQVRDSLNQLGPPLMSQVGRMAYEDALSLFNPMVVDGRHYSLRTRWLATPADAAGQLLTEAARGFTSPYSAIAVHHFHGAAARVGPADTAFALRRDHVMVEVVTAWEPGDPGQDQHQRWADQLSDGLVPHAIPGGYPNLLGADDRERTLLAYGPNLTRLRALQQRFDPDGLFSTAVGSTVPPAPVNG